MRTAREYKKNTKWGGGGERKTVTWNLKTKEIFYNNHIYQNRIFPRSLPQNTMMNFVQFLTYTDRRRLFSLT